MKSVPKRRRGTPEKFPDAEVKKVGAYEKFRKGFSVLAKPETTSPTMPKRVSSLVSDDISNLMFRISAWRDYTDDLIYEATTEYLQAKERHQYQWDISMVLVTGSSVKEKEAKVRVMQKVKVLREELMDKEMYLDLLERKHENYSNNIAIISREISRRSNMS